MRPLTLDNLKAELRIDYDQDDALLQRLLVDAIALVERDTQIAIRERTETAYLSQFADCLLPVQPVTAIASVKYVRDSDGVEVTVSASTYWIDRSRNPLALLRFRSTPSGVREGTVAIAYTVGGTTVPEGLARAVVALVGHFYNNPEAAAPVSLVEVPLGYRYAIELYSGRSPVA